MHKLAFLFALLLLINIGSSAQLSPSEQSNIRVAVDGDSPIISIMSPKNITYGNATILINYTISDITIDSAWYSLNNKENISISNPFYLALPEGSYNLRIYANDSSNRINFSEVFFRINNSVPFCGDVNCNSGEDCSACPIDCGSCPTSASGAGGGGGMPPKSNKSEDLENKSKKPIPASIIPIENKENKSGQPISAGREREVNYAFLIIGIFLILIVTLIGIFLYLKTKVKKKSRKITK